MPTNLLKVVISCLLLATCVSCAKDPARDVGPEREVVPAGLLAAPSVQFRFAVYYVPTPSGEPSAALERVTSEKPQQFKRVEAIDAVPSEPVVLGVLRRDVREAFAPPSVSSLQYSGHGLSREQAEALQKSEQAFVMDFAYPKRAGLGPLLSANRVAENVARATGGLLWDEETREHDEELLAASRAAREKLPALLKSFSAGLQPGDFIQVKAPFATPDGGNEWMWVEVVEWKGDRIKGLLKNGPFNIPSMHAGPVVEVKQAEVFDYIRRFPDGRIEGNTTAAIIERNQKQGDAR